MSAARPPSEQGGIEVSLVQTLEGHQGAIYDLCLDHRGHLLSVGGDGLLVKWKRQGDAFEEGGHALAKSDAPLFVVRSLPDGGVLAGTGDGGVLNGSERDGWTLAPANAGGTYVLTEQATGGADGRWLKRSTGETLATVNGRIRCFLALPEGQWLGTSEGCIHDMARGVKTDAHEGPVRAMIPWPGKQALASVGGDGQLRIWKVGPEGGLRPIIAIPAHKGTIYRASPSPDGKWVATCSRDRSIALWDADSLALVQRLQRPGMPGHVRSVNAIVWTGAHTLASAGDGGRILIWKLLGADRPPSN